MLSGWAVDDQRPRGVMTSGTPHKTAFPLPFLGLASPSLPYLAPRPQHLVSTCYTYYLSPPWYPAEPGSVILPHQHLISGQQDVKLPPPPPWATDLGPVDLSTPLRAATVLHHLNRMGYKKEGGGGYVITCTFQGLPQHSQTCMTARYRQVGRRENKVTR